MKAELKPKISFSLNLELTESEARALNAIFSYSATDFLDVFYQNLGKEHLRPHESGFYDLNKSIEEKLRPQLIHIDKIYYSVNVLLKK